MLDFPNSPNDGQVFVDSSGAKWFYEAATNSWTAESAVVTVSDIYIHKNIQNLPALP
jgi:hypothetical protein